MDVARVDPSTVDAGAIGFRLGPRLNAAGRLLPGRRRPGAAAHRGPERARAVALELDANNTERRDVETRIRFEAEAQVAEQGPRRRLRARLRGLARRRDRHRRRADRRAPPPPGVLIALDGEEGTGSGRSIPALRPARRPARRLGHLQRYGGHRAAAGLTIARGDVAAFREAFAAHAATCSRPRTCVREVRVDAVAPGDALRSRLAEELEQLAPVRPGQPRGLAARPGRAARRPAADGRGPPRRASRSPPAAPARAACCSAPAAPARRARRAGRGRRPRSRQPLERHRSSPGSCCATPTEPRRSRSRSSASPRSATGCWRELARDLGAWGRRAGADRDAEPVLDARGTGIAGLLADLVATGEPVLAVAATRPIAPGCSADASAASRSAPGRRSRTTRRWPPATPTWSPSTRRAPRRSTLLIRPRGWTHLAWGEPELRFAPRIHQWDFALRDPLAAVYRALRAARQAGGEACEALLRGEGPQPRSAALAGRLVRVLSELDLVDLDREGPALRVAEAPERAPRSSAPPPSGPTIDALRTDSDS